MVDQNMIKIKGGRYELTSQVVFILLTDIRHILQELTVASYVPNDTYLTSGTTLDANETTSSVNCDPSMLILTGPNYSGKSAYIKQVSDNLAMGKSYLIRDRWLLLSTWHKLEGMGCYSGVENCKSARVLMFSTALFLQKVPSWG